ncbi:MAG: tetratricopeptide repeat protein [Candidatus Omnitrophota bacterium]|nr:tetratricopeptide repeat protein [Candidatus Omnitrophota bacterium]
MKRIILVLILGMALSLIMPAISKAEYNFGDNRSVTLTTKAWEALDKGDIEAVLAFTNKCITLYTEQAKAMQASLKDYVKSEAEGGTNQDVFNYWALNDIGTCLFIQGEAFRKAKMDEEAKEAYKTVIDKYSFAQCWDPKGWFWKPAEAAKERLMAIETGKSYDFGDYRSETLTVKAWAALDANDLDAVLVYTNKCIDLYKDKAKQMQSSLKAYPWKTNEEIFSYWALNDVGTCLFIQGKALRSANKIEEAKAAFKRIIDEFSYSQCWDPKGWFWKPVDGAREQLAEI